jgi:putative transposase
VGWNGGAHAQEDARQKARIEAIHNASHGTYEAPRVHAELQAIDGLGIGRKRVARLMWELGIEGVSRRGKRQAPKPEREAPVAGTCQPK